MRVVIKQDTGWRLRCAQGNRYITGLDPEQVGYWLTHIPGHKVTLPSGERVTLLEMEAVAGWFVAEITGKDRVVRGWCYSQVSKDHALQQLRK
jgi:hypothetical protein